MREIFLSEDGKVLAEFLKRKRIACPMIIAQTSLPEDREKGNSADFSEAIRLPQLSGQELAEISRGYIDSISKLGARYSSRDWWANSLSEKNEHESSLYRNICLFINLTKTLQACKEDSVGVICDASLVGQLKDFCRQNRIMFFHLGRKWWRCAMTHLYEQMLYLRRNVLFLCQSLGKNIQAQAFGRDPLKGLNKDCGYFVLRSWVNESSFVKNGVWQDPFFGRLPLFIKSKNLPVLILVGVTGDYKKTLSGLAGIKDVLVLPEDMFISWFALGKIVISALFRAIKLKDHVLIQQVVLTRLYEQELRNSYENLTFHRNLAKYYIGRNLALKVKFSRYLQTYENYAWEKMMILGIRSREEVKGRPLIIGFQHVFVSRNSFKYFFGKEEKDVMPLPDRIVTLGKNTSEILQRYGNYEHSLLQPGCALRQEYIPDLSLCKKTRLNRILVPLTMSTKESVRVLNFLFLSGLDKTSIQTVIRCHPFAPFSGIREHLKFELPANFMVSNEKSIVQTLQEVDMVVYTWSTVAIEALMAGLPIIYMDILYPLCTDPLFECGFLKKAVRYPNELVPALNAFYALSDDLFHKQYRESQDYLREYFYPVTEENLNVFLYG